MITEQLIYRIVNAAYALRDEAFNIQFDGRNAKPWKLTPETIPDAPNSPYYVIGRRVWILFAELKRFRRDALHAEAVPSVTIENNSGAVRAKITWAIGSSSCLNIFIFEDGATTCEISNPYKRVTPEQAWNILVRDYWDEHAPSVRDEIFVVLRAGAEAVLNISRLPSEMEQTTGQRRPPVAVLMLKAYQAFERSKSFERGGDKFSQRWAKHWQACADRYWALLLALAYAGKTGVLSFGLCSDGPDCIEFAAIFLRDLAVFLPRWRLSEAGLEMFLLTKPSTSKSWPTVTAFASVMSEETAPDAFWEVWNLSDVASDFTHLLKPNAKTR